jgi:Ca-activated chloride channel family protein
MKSATSLFAALLLPAIASASPSKALREYKAGQYEQSLKEYQQLLEKQNDDPRLHFNAGAAAYRNRQFDEAAKQFDSALASPDLKLQQQAYYNQGNTLFRLGEANPDPSKRSETWQKSLKDYELSMKLNPQDADAKFNHEFVKKMLEELKQQQQQQQNQQKDKQDKDQKQDQNQQQQSQNNQQQQDQDKQQNQQQNQQQQAKQDQSKQQQDSSQQKQQAKQDQQQAANQSQEQKQKQQPQQAQKDQQQPQASQAPGEQKDKSEKDQEQAAYAAGQMTPAQARQLLDAQKGEEMMLPSKPEGKPADRSRSFKDW